MNFQYQTICQNILLRGLAERTRQVISRRFALFALTPSQGGAERQTLEAIGKSLGITRERVRQIEEDGLARLREKALNPRCQNIFLYFNNYLKNSGSLKREDILLAQLGGQKFQNYVFFLLTLNKGLTRFPETRDFYSFWTIDKIAFNRLEKTMNSLIDKLQKEKQPLTLSLNIPSSYLEISKAILKGPEGLYGLREWPEINPRGVKDRAYLVLRKAEKPLHFTQVATLINTSNLFSQNKLTIPQTVHNELIKDPRFVLVGRGLYALREWGYQPGIVREVIAKVLTGAHQPLAKEEIMGKVLSQRQVKPNTVILNLANKKYFIKNSEGKYYIRKA